MKRFSAALLAIACAGTAFFPLETNAQSRGKLLHIVVPFGSGGAREVLLRTFDTELATALGETAIVENKPGAGGAIGTAYVAAAAPDGHTLLFAASSHNVTALLGASPPYHPIQDFTAVANIGMQSYVMMTTSQLHVSSVAELIQYAKANPGKLNYSSAGHGSSSHLAMAYFASLAGVNMVHIPFKSTQQAVNEVLAGRVHAVIVPNVGAIPFAKDDRLHLLGVTSKKRSRFLPDVPAIAESGLPEYEFESWFGLLAPARTPKTIVDRINAQVGKLLKSPVILERLARQGVEPLPLTPADFENLVREDHEKMARIVKKVGRIE
jgi:tripartite-type tricarboxylate transporter receptor subunit TctC